MLRKRPVYRNWLTDVRLTLEARPNLSWHTNLPYTGEKVKSRRTEIETKADGPIEMWVACSCSYSRGIVYKYNPNPNAAQISTSMPSITLDPLQQDHLALFLFLQPQRCLTV